MLKIKPERESFRKEAITKRQQLIELANKNKNDQKYAAAITLYNQALAIIIPGLIHDFTATNAMDPVTKQIEAEIENCLRAMQRQVEALLQEASMLLESNDLIATRAKVAQAKQLLPELGQTVITSAIINLESRILWQQNKNNLHENSSRLLVQNIDLVNINSCGKLAADLRTYIHEYDKYNGKHSAEDIAHIKRLREKLQKVEERISVHKLQMSWKDKQVAAMASYQALIQQNQQQVDLHTHAQQLQELAKIYTTHKLCLTTQEDLVSVDIERRLLGIEVQLQSLKDSGQREIDRAKNCEREQQITHKLREIQADLHKCLLADALKKLRAVEKIAAKINNEDDITEKLYAQRGYFSKAIDDLQEELQKFNRARANDSLLLSEQLIVEALKQCKHECEHTLLERHFERVRNEVNEEFFIQWVKFYKKSAEETQHIFDTIVKFICDDLIPTTFLKRWAPTNWSNAGLYLESSKTIAPKIRDKLREYQPASEAFYLQLGIKFPEPEDVTIKPKVTRNDFC